MKYRPEIDGLRAVAVVPVILFHAGFDLFSGGFVGVDVFFVISGYLITTLLIEDIENNRFSIVRFYERRARRILPALFVVMLTCIPFAWMWMLPNQMKDFSQSLVAVSLFASNILFWKQSGYFAAAAEEKPLLHTWSLAVEEQYYLLFPVFLFVAWRFGRNRVFWSIAVLAGASLLLSEWGWRNKPDANFYLAPTRAWELLVGSIAAFIANKRGPQTNDILAWLGLGGIAFAIFWYDELTPFPSVYGLVPVIGTALIVLFGNKGTSAARLLSMNAFVGIGLVSYSAYLWHQPLLAFARVYAVGAENQLVIGILVFCSFVLAACSWKYVEVPFRNTGGSFGSRAYIFGGFSVILLSLLLFGIVGNSRDGFLGRYEVTPQFLADFRLPMRWEGYCFYSFNDRDLVVADEGIECDLGNQAENQPTILLFGDSFAAHWEPYFKELANENQFGLRSVTTNWCFPSNRANYTAPRGHKSISQCEINRRWLIENFSTFDYVVFAGAWHSIEHHGFGVGVMDLIEILSKVSTTQFSVIDIPPQFHRDSVENAVYSKAVTLVPNDSANELGKRFWANMQGRFSDQDNVHLIGQDEIYYNATGDFKSDEGFPFSLDGSHISVYGAKQIYLEMSERGTTSRLLGITGKE